MSDDLFEPVAQANRERLRALGWYEAAGRLCGRPMWRRPDGAVVDEEESVRWLECLKKQEVGDADKVKREAPGAEAEVPGQVACGPGAAAEVPGEAAPVLSEAPREAGGRGPGEHAGEVEGVV